MSELDTVSYFICLAGESSRQKTFLNQGKNQDTRNLILTGNCNDWDLTTLFYCLLYSSHQLIPFARYVTQRVPPLLSSEWIDNLREKRNRMAHSSKSCLSQADFNSFFADIKQAFDALKFPTSRLSRLGSGKLSTLDVQKLEQTLTNERNRYTMLYFEDSYFPFL